MKIKKHKDRLKIKIRIKNEHLMEQIIKKNE